MLFEVTLSDGTSRIMQAHNKGQLKQALQGVSFAKAEPRRLCKVCRKVAATVLNNLCPECWNTHLEHCRDAWKDVTMTEQELRDTAMSYFVAV